MNLLSPVTIQRPSYVGINGEAKTPRPLTLTELDITIIDNAKRRVAEARLLPCPRPVVLWEKEAYDAAGDYTQAQVEARVLEVLGSDVKAGLEALFVRPTK
jgi:hypothetical protein